MFFEENTDKRLTVKFSGIIVQCNGCYDGRWLRENHFITAGVKDGIHCLICLNMNVNLSSWLVFNWRTISQSSSDIQLWRYELKRKVQSLSEVFNSSNTLGCMMLRGNAVLGATRIMTHINLKCHNSTVTTNHSYNLKWMLPFPTTWIVTLSDF